MKRTKLSERPIPNYPRGVENANIITHGIGIIIGIATLIACVRKAAAGGDPLNILGAVVYGITMTSLFTISTIYHACPPDRSKLVMQVMDHCAIYSFIAGTYTPVLLCRMVPEYPAIGWGLLALQWGLTIVATTLTAIDLHRFRTFSQTCYIAMGWSIIIFAPQTIAVLTPPGFWLMFAGGVTYTLGALCFMFDRKYVVMHSVFHVFVIAATILQSLSVYLYAI